ncbi:MAG TPA: tRNA-dihydrouridine synthase family protein [Bacteriovoracaceae bacterium]|nr:tRNA-dihydrouridine synthase family protein [Bacteriovoracaceae bacterium]
MSTTFSPALTEKLNHFKGLATPISLGSVSFSSRLLLAPMAGICNIPFRLLMEDLGAGGTVSELISCHGINYGNKRTLDMLKIHPLEKNVGIQLFGEDADSMARAAEVAESFGPKFLDINMGCPVNKVVSKGGGSALMKELEKLAPLFSKMRSSMKIPLSIKIRTGWDQNNLNAKEVMKIASDSGIEWVAIHGRTRTQQYTGTANWEYIESLNEEKKLPLIGNGDLHHPYAVSQRLQNTSCDALMIARGALRNPFIFAESLDPEYANKRRSVFLGNDYWEVIQKLYEYTSQTFEDERMILVQVRKLIVWFAAGFPRAAAFRSQVFASQSLSEVMSIAQEYFQGLGDAQKFINYDEVFMSSGHG